MTLVASWLSAKDALFRFPLALMSAVVAMAFFVLAFHDPGHAEAAGRYRAGLAYFIGVPLFTLLALLGEAWVGKRRYLGTALGAAGLLMVEGYRLSLGGVSPGTLGPRTVQIGLAFFGLLALVPVFFRAPSDSVVAFFRTVLGRAVRAMGAFVLAAVGLYVFLLMASTLLQVPFRAFLFERILLQGVTVLAVWYFLAGIPASFGGRSSSWKGVHIRLAGPRGAVFPILLGALTLVAFGVRYPSNVIDLANYFLLLFSFWAIGTGIYLSFASQANLRMPALVLSFLLVLGSFGPWSAYSVVEASQLADLKKTLSGIGILEGGQLQKPKRSPTKEERARVEKRLDTIHPLFGYTTVHAFLGSNVPRQPANEGIYDRDRTGVFLKLMGLQSTASQYVSFYSREDQPKEVLGWQVMLPLHSQSAGSRKSIEWQGKTIEVWWDENEETLNFYDGGEEIGRLDVSKVLSKLNFSQERVSQLVPGASLRLGGKWKSLEVQVDFNNLVARRRPDRGFKAVSFESEILMKFPKS